MIKVKRYLYLFIPCLLLITGAFYLLTSMGWISLDKAVVMRLSIALLVIFAIGTVIVVPGLYKDPERFAIHFLGLTTFQMLSAFGVVGYLAFQKIDQVKSIGLHFIGIFCLLLFLQSFFLIRINRTNS
jgi:hypothetical protein